MLKKFVLKYTRSGGISGILQVRWSWNVLGGAVAVFFIRHYNDWIISYTADALDELGVTRHLMTSRQDVALGADLADTSAVMDRSFLVMGQIGLFGPGLLIPEPVADELATLAEGPDPVAARRSRRGLEAIDELRKLGIRVTFVQGDVPGAASIEEKVAILADRLDRSEERRVGKEGRSRGSPD